VGRRKERDEINRRGIGGKWRREDVGGEGRRGSGQREAERKRSLFSSMAESIFFL
jgi:hypothetical protein